MCVGCVRSSINLSPNFSMEKSYDKLIDNKWYCDDHRFIVHPMVQPTKLADIDQLAHDHLVIAPLKRIVDAIFNILMMVDIPNLLRVSGRERIVQQQADLHAPIGSLQQVLEDRQSNVVAVPEEGLQVNGFSCTVDRPQSPFQRFISGIQGMYPITRTDTFDRRP